MRINITLNYTSSYLKEIQIEMKSKHWFCQDGPSSLSSTPSSSGTAKHTDGSQGTPTCNPHAEGEVNNVYYTIASLCAKPTCRQY